MTLAIISDIHGNLSALEAVIKDLERIRPDRVVQGGDLVFGGARPVEVLDRVRGLGWQGVMGNTDEVLWNPAALANFPEPARAGFGRQVEATQTRLGEERLQWLRSLPLQWKGDGVGLVHAVPGNVWPAVQPDADDATLQKTYGQLGAAIAVYGHIHLPYVRRLPGLIVANTGSVGLPADGDRRASYLLINNGEPVIRRVAYDVEAEAGLLEASGLPQAAVFARALRNGTLPGR